MIFVCMAFSPQKTRLQTFSVFPLIKHCITWQYLVKHYDALVGVGVRSNAEVPRFVAFFNVKHSSPVVCVYQVKVRYFESHHLHPLCILLDAAVILKVKHVMG